MIAQSLRSGSLASLLVLAVATSPVRAQDASEPGDTQLDLAAEAGVLFELGVEAQRAGHYLDALEHYLASERLAPNANVVFNVALCFEHLERWTDAFRYYDEYARGELGAEDRQLVETALARVRPRVAIVHVVSEPAGATVFLDRRDLGARGRTPIALAVDPDDAHVVLVEQGGYDPAQSEPVTVPIGGEASVSLSLARILGTLVVETEPAGAEIRVDALDGPVAGTTPSTLSLTPGAHTIYLRAVGHRPAHVDARVEPRAESTQHTVLALETGALVVDADETGALIEVDGEPRGFTPAVLDDVPAGHHRIRIAHAGFHDVEEEIDVAPSGRASISARMHLAQEVSAASRETESLDDVPADVSLVSSEELRAFGWQTITDAVAGLRGVYQTNDLFYPSVGLRGFSQPQDYGNHLLVTMDGHTMNDDMLGSSYVGYDARADLLDVERIELVRGPGSALYGTNAFFGVINTVMRDRNSLLSPHVSFATDGASMGRLRVGGGTRIADDVGFWASASGVLSQGNDWVFPEVDPDHVVRGANGFQSGTIAIRGWAGDFTLEGSINRRDQRVATGAFGTVPGDPRTHSTDTRGYLELRWEPHIDIVQLHVRAYVDTYLYDGDWGYTGDDGTGTVVDTTTRDRWQGVWVGGEARGTIAATDWLRVTVGAESRGSAVAHLASESDVDRTGVADRYLNEDPRFFVVAGYAVADVRPIRELEINAGLRYDYVSTFTDGAFNPRGTIFVRPWEGGTFRLMGGGAFRAPSPYELRYFDGGLTQVQAGRLNAERIWTGQLEYTHRVDDVSVVATAFYNDISAFVTTVDRSSDPTCTSGSCFGYANSDQVARTMGAEAEVRRDFRRGWMVAVTYSYQRTRFGDLFSDAATARITNSPEHMASVRAVAPIVPEIVSIAGRVRVESPRLAQREGSPLVESPVPVLVDITLSGRIAAIHLDYALGLRNLLDWHYAYPGGNDVPMLFVPQQGRTFFLQTTLWY